MVLAASRNSHLELPPPVGRRLLIVATGLEQGYLRARTLDEMGYRVTVCGNPAEAQDMAREHNANAVLVDLGRDAMGQADLVCGLRPATQGPIVVVAGSGDAMELLRAYEAGADEVCSPRTSTAELDLRFRALFRLQRRANSNDAEQVNADVLRAGDLEIDLASQVVRKRGRVVQLSPTEFRLLATLAENTGRVVPSKALIARVWGDQYAGETHYLRLYVRYLRQKLEDDPSKPHYIVNRWGAGYALEAPPAAA